MARQSVKDQILSFLSGLMPGLIPGRKKDPASSDTALVIFKPQRSLCDPRLSSAANGGTDAACGNIERLAQKFRKAAIPIYVVYEAEEPRRAADIDFHIFKPDKKDILICQEDSRDFLSVAAALEKGGHRNVFICGVSLMSDVFNFASDLKDNGKLNLTLLADLTANNNEDKKVKFVRQRFESNGVRISSAAAELVRLR